MTLYFRDSKGQEVTVAQHLTNPEEAVVAILNHSKSRFAVPTGGIKVKVVGIGNFSFTSSDGKNLGYTLRD